MKKLWCLLLLTLPVFSYASNYPADYSDQTVRVLTKGPAIFAHVGSGSFSAEVIGYKSSGSLAQNNPESLNAIVTVECRFERDGATTVTTKNTVVKLGREWNGTGYISEEHSYYSYQPSECRGSNGQVQVAFSDNQGNWDSLNGANYRYVGYGFYELNVLNEGVVSFATREAGYRVNLKAWDFIIEQMKK